jgi:hypothetical protein
VGVEFFALTDCLLKSLAAFEEMLVGSDAGEPAFGLKPDTGRNVERDTREACGLHVEHF